MRGGMTRSSYVYLFIGLRYVRNVTTNYRIDVKEPVSWRVKLNIFDHTETSFNPLLPSATYMRRSAKIWF